MTWGTARAGSLVTAAIGMKVATTTAMKRAIDSGADINETDRDWFPLMMAVATNNEEVVSLLLRNGAEVDKTDSAGLTSLQPEDDLESMLQRVDLALYQAKQGGRDRLCVAQE